MRVVRRAYVVLLAMCFLCVPLNDVAAQEGSAKPEAKAKAKANAKRATSKRATSRKQKATRQRKAKQRKAKQRKAKQRKAKRKRSARARKAARKKRANRPKGWQWPPTPAMRTQGKACLKTLSRLGVSWKAAGRRKGIVTPIVVRSLTFNDVKLAPTFRKPPFVMDCHLAVALAKASPAIKAAGVSELRFSSIYSYRRAKVNGVQKQALSRHSYGLAVDIYQVRDSADEIFIVEDQYADVAVIRELEDVLNATGLFRLVLSPANDPRSHSDHLHLEARVSKIGKAGAAKRRHKKRARKRKRARKKK